MKEFFVKLYDFVKGIILRMIKKFFVTATAGAIDNQMLVHSRAAEKSGLTITSQKISWLIFVETNADRIDNVENVVCATAKKMNLEPTGDEFAEKLEGAKKKNPDFFNSFFDSVKNISNEEVCQYWEAILKGELEQPGSMPVSVIEILRKLDKDVAILFDKAFQFNCRDWIFIDMEEQFPISIGEIHKLIEHGLVLPIIFGHVTEININENGWGYFYHCGMKILIERMAGDGKLQIPSLRFTTSGYLLAATINKIRLPNAEYLARVAKFVGSEETRESTLGGFVSGKFRLWISMQSGKRILIDPEKENGGIICELIDDEKIGVTQTSP